MCKAKLADICREEGTTSSFHKGMREKKICLSMFFDYLVCVCVRMRKLKSGPFLYEGERSARMLHRFVSLSCLICMANQSSRTK